MQPKNKGVLSFCVKNRANFFLGQVFMLQWLKSSSKIALGVLNDRESRMSDPWTQNL